MGFDRTGRGFNFGESAILAVTLHQTKTHKAMKEEIYYVADSLGVMQPMTIERPDWSIARFFVEGGAGAMTIISILLIALFIAAWKAPKWVKEIGLGALVVSVFCTLLGLYQIFDAIQIFGDVSFPVICGGLKVAMITTFYGLIVYFITLVIRVIQKPRI